MDADHLKKARVFSEVSADKGTTYQSWHKAVFSEKGSPFDKKTMELMALSASCAIKCQYCIESHGNKAKKFGATPEEIAHVIQIASSISAGATMAYGVEAMDAETSSK